MPSIDKFVDLMRYWCDDGNLGYCQAHRNDIRYGGEADCSSLVIHCLREAGFDTGNASYTGNMSANLCARGWVEVPNNGRPQRGDILLHHKNHVAVWLGDCLAQASIDERGKTSGGQPGDQTGRETNTRSYYNYPWNCYLRYQNQGAILKKPANLSNSTGGEQVYNFRLVKRGSTGNHVKMLQSTLNERAGANLAVDGSAGNLTDAAIRNWQRSHGLEVDGSCGKLTWNSLLSA